MKTYEVWYRNLNNNDVRVDTIKATKVKIRTVSPGISSAEFYLSFDLTRFYSNVIKK